MSPDRRAVLLLLGLAVLGQVIRGRLTSPDGPPGDVQLRGAGSPGSPIRHRDSSVASGRPLAPGERIDLDRAGAAEIARLPRVGLGLARKIVADRTAHGPFGNLAGLDRVAGVGPGLLRAIEGHVRFSLPPPGGSAADASLETGPRPVPRPAPSLDLNSATVAQLESLPHLGPYMARQIVAFRARHGPFPAVDSLVRVPGIGPATLARVRDRLEVH
jgi:competence protein ComEA